MWNNRPRGIPFESHLIFNLGYKLSVLVSRLFVETPICRYLVGWKLTKTGFASQNPLENGFVFWYPGLRLAKLYCQCFSVVIIGRVHRNSRVLCATHLFTSFMCNSSHVVYFDQHLGAFYVFCAKKQKIGAKFSKTSNDSIAEDGR